MMYCRRCDKVVVQMVGSIPPGGTATNRPCGHKAGIRVEADAMKLMGGDA